MCAKVEQMATNPPPISMFILGDYVPQIAFILHIEAMLYTCKAFNENGGFFGRGQRVG